MTLEQIDKEYVLHSYGRNYTNFVKGSGAKLFDENGKEYIDFGSGIGEIIKLCASIIEGIKKSSNSFMNGSL